MGNLGMPELIFILVLALLIFGPKKLPEIGRQIGKGLGEFKRASNDLKRSIADEIDKAAVDAPAPAAATVEAPAESSSTKPAAPRAPEGTVASEHEGSPERPS